MEDIWQCKICENELKEDARILPCGHSFCFQCIFDNFKTSQTCSRCEFSFTRSVEELPLNVPFIHWKSLNNSQLNNNNNNNNNINNNNEPVKINNNNDINKNKCYECEIKEAIIYCEECEHVLCGDCTEKIHSLKVMRNHSQVLIGIFPSKKKKQNLQCQKHIEKKKKLYCRDCSLFICTLCVKDHTKHHILHANDLINEKKEEWRKELKKFNPIYDRMKYNVEDIDKKIKLFKEEIELLQSKINNLIIEREEFDILKEKIHSTTQFLHLTIDSYSYSLNSIGECDKFISLFTQEKLTKIYSEINREIFSSLNLPCNLKWDYCEKATIKDKNLISTVDQGWGNSNEFSTNFNTIYLNIKPSNNGWFAIGVGKLKGNTKFKPGYGWKEAGSVDFYYRAMNGMVNDILVEGSMKKTESLITLTFLNCELRMKIGDYQLPNSYPVPELSILYVDIYHAGSCATLQVADEI